MKILAIDGSQENLTAVHLDELTGKARRYLGKRGGAVSASIEGVTAPLPAEGLRPGRQHQG